MRQILQIAERRGRKVAIAGRGFLNSIEVGVELGYLKPASSLIVELADAERMPAREVIILATGSQGEPQAALSRMAVGDHRELRHPGGRHGRPVVEPGAGQRGERLAHDRQPLPARRRRDLEGDRAERPRLRPRRARELGELIDLLRPTYAVPLHGEYRMQVLYRRLAIEHGLKPDQRALPGDRPAARLEDGKVKLDGSIPAGSVLVDGLEIGGVDEAVLRDRQHLAGDGVVIVSVTMDRQTGEILVEPEIIARGVADEQRAKPALDAACQAVERALRRLDPAELDVGFVHDRMHEVTLSVLRQQAGMRPLVLPVVVEI